MVTVSNGRCRWAASAVIAGILAVAACGGGPAVDLETLQPASPPPDSEVAQPPPSDAVTPPPTASPPEPAPAAPSPEPESPPPEPPPTATTDASPPEPWAIHVDADTVWRDVFDRAARAEQACIRSALGDDLDSLLEERLMTDADTEEWVASIFGCLTPDNARSLFLAGMVAGLREELGTVELGDEEMSCLRDLVADLDIAALVAADVAGEADFEFAEATAFLIGCLPDVFIAVMLAEMGVEPDELSEDELSCMREWMSATDWAALMGAETDDEALDAFGSLFELVSCIPDLFDLPDPEAAGPDDHGDFIEEATAVTVGEPVHAGVDHGGDVDVFVFEAVAGESYRIEVTLGSLEDSVLVLYDPDGRELAFNDDRDADSLASLITWSAPGSGSYYVEVASFDSFGIGSYTLSVTTG